MILTCPECATSYFVDDHKIPTEGRIVRCASCRARWTAYPEAEEPLVEEPAAFAPEPEPEPAVEPEVAAVAADDFPRRTRPPRPADHGRKREAAATGMIWAGMAAVLVVLIAIAVIFRVEMVKLWPSSASAFAWAGMPVNGTGLEIEGVRYEPSVQDNHRALSVSGTIRNTQSKPITSPPLRIALVSRTGEVLAAKIARPADAVIPPGQTRHFAIALVDFPASAHELQVGFAPASAIPHAAPAAVGHVLAPPEPAHGAAEPVEARSLPPGSPDALAEHGDSGLAQSHD